MTAEGEPTTRCLIADDQAMVREGFAAVLAAQPGLVVVGQAGDGAEAVRQVRELQPDVLDALTQREIEALRLIARGLSNSEISDTLVIAMQTTKTYVGRILTKLDLRDRAQAVVLAYEVGLVAPGASGRARVD
jgi:DNA-binding NarL/FixJ family response regulator